MHKGANKLLLATDEMRPRPPWAGNASELPPGLPLTPCVRPCGACGGGGSRFRIGRAAPCWPDAAREGSNLGTIKAQHRVPFKRCRPHRWVSNNPQHLSTGRCGQQRRGKRGRPPFSLRVSFERHQRATARSPAARNVPENMRRTPRAWFEWLWAFDGSIGRPIAR